MAAKTVLGLDLGTNSIGWSLIRIDAENSAGSVQALGVRIFQEGLNLEKGREQPKNATRRRKRAERRIHQRRNRRRAKLPTTLQSAGLFPTQADELKAVLQSNPYQLRADGLNRALLPFEFGRAVYHLAQRRGFKSNRKAAIKDADEEKGKVKAGISDLERRMEERSSVTVGQYLHWFRQQREPQHERIRVHYTHRTMFEKEFDLLWERQSPSIPALQDEQLRQRVRDAIFFQRPFKLQKDLINLVSSRSRR